MPIEIDWYLPDRILYVQLQETLTLDEIRANSDTFVAQIESSDAELVHALHDNATLTSVPKRLKDLSESVKSAYSHPNLGWTVAYNTDDAVLKFLGNMLSGLFNLRYKIVDTKAEALAWLQRVDPSLPPLTDDTASDEPSVD